MYTVEERVLNGHWEIIKEFDDLFAAIDFEHELLDLKKAFPTLKIVEYRLGVRS